MATRQDGGSSSARHGAGIRIRRLAARTHRLQPGARLFIIYADRKLMTPATIARIETQFHLPPERTGVQGDFHYQSKETPNGLSGVSRHELRPDIYPSETDRRRA